MSTAKKKSQVKSTYKFLYNMQRIFGAQVALY